MTVTRRLIVDASRVHVYNLSVKEPGIWVYLRVNNGQNGVRR